MSHQAPPDNAVAAPVVPDYRLLHVIGRGAFGEVWLAEETLTGVHRAVKLLAKRALAGDARILRELDGVREYQQKSRGHPFLVQIHHVGETPDFYYYTMELADDARVPHPTEGGVGDSKTACRVPRPSGVGDIRARFEHDEPGVPPGAGPSASDRYEPLTLAALIEREAPMPAARALDVTAQVLRGLEHLHDQGLIHRDVKPSNVLVVDGRIKLGDMGLVTPMDRDVTLVFTPGYAPSDAKVDHTFDLFATGIILYEMLTGYHRSKFPELPAFRPPTRRERHELRAAIRIANKGAHPDRRERYKSATEFLHDAERPCSAGYLGMVRFGLLSTAICLAALGAIWHFGRTSAPRTPQATPPMRVRFQGLPEPRDDHVAIVTDDRGRSWSKRFPVQITRPWLIDLNRDEVPELVVATAGPNPGESAEEGGKLYAFTAFTDSASLMPFWPQPLVLYIRPPWETKTPPDTCGARIDLHGQIDAKPGEDLIVTVSYPGCACRIVIVSGEGRVVGEYWHYGHMGVKQFLDVGAGQPAILCMGFCNHPEQEGHEEAKRAAMILDIGPGGSLSGRWRYGETTAPDIVGSLRGYGESVRTGEYPDGSPQRAESDRWALPDFAIIDMRRLPLLRMELNNGLILLLDDRLRQVGAGLEKGSRWDNAQQLPGFDTVWQTLWPPDEKTETEPPAGDE